MQKTWKNGRGFTIVELLVVIVIISILAVITAVAYNGVQTRSKISKMETDITTVQRLVEAYKARNGSYPTTAASLNVDWSQATARTDANCTGGTKSVDWVPNLSTSLPQSTANTTGVSGYPGCYVYVSDGTNYVISAWNMLKDVQTDTLYKRLGFREMSSTYPSYLYYICNHSAVGGASGTYNAAIDYYKHSMTVTNITSCNETPPTGA